MGLGVVNERQRGISLDGYSAPRAGALTIDMVNNKLASAVLSVSIPISAPAINVVLTTGPNASSG
jgi:hypothetical protein